MYQTVDKTENFPDWHRPVEKNYESEVNINHSYAKYEIY